MLLPALAVLPASDGTGLDRPDPALDPDSTGVGMGLVVGLVSRSLVLQISWKVKLEFSLSISYRFLELCPKRSPSLNLHMDLSLDLNLDLNLSLNLNLN